jgi:DHA2 family multidrug resistance protein
MVMAMMPIVGFLVTRVDQRWMIVYGFAISSLALFTMLNLNLGVSYGYVAMLRVFQAAGLAFLFIPINTLSYVGIPMTKNNDVSGLTNLARNIGGSVGTAFLVTVLARRQQFHQERLSTWITPNNPTLQNQVDGLGRYLIQHGGRVNSLIQGRALAQGNLYGQLLRHATMLSYLDVIKALAIAVLFLIPLVFLMKKPPKGTGPGGGH